jgi:hypothetical protein
VGNKKPKINNIRDGRLVSPQVDLYVPSRPHLAHSGAAEVAQLSVDEHWRVAMVL